MTAAAARLTIRTYGDIRTIRIRLHVLRTRMYFKKILSRELFSRLQCLLSNLTRIMDPHFLFALDDRRP